MNARRERSPSIHVSKTRAAVAAVIEKGHDMGKQTMKLDEKVAFLEVTVGRLQRTVEELNVQVLGLRQEMHSIRRAASPVDEPVQESKAPPHFRAP